MAERLFSPNQIARLLGATPTAVFEWMEKGWLNYRRIGQAGSIRITEGSLITFLRKQGVDLGDLLDKTVPADQRAEVHREAQARQIASAGRTISTLAHAPRAIVKADGVEEVIEAEPVEAPAPDPRAGQVCDAILADAVKHGAEAIHLTPRGDRLDLQLRIGGVLRDKPHFAGRLPDALKTEIVPAMLTRADPDIDPAAMTAAHHGELTRRIDGREITAHFSALPTANGTRLVIHLPRQAEA